MFESKLGSKTEDLEIIVRRGPHGAVVLSAIAVAIVIGIWFAFYFFEFLPRGFTR
jgi:uncharacterized membrane protein SpoIIM required for sporulation